MLDMKFFCHSASYSFEWLCSIIRNETFGRVMTVYPLCNLIKFHFLTNKIETQILCLFLVYILVLKAANNATLSGRLLRSWSVSQQKCCCWDSWSLLGSVNGDRFSTQLVWKALVYAESLMVMRCCRHLRKLHIALICQKSLLSERSSEKLKFHV
jgi:hypothetical protein